MKTSARRNSWIMGKGEDDEEQSLPQGQIVSIEVD